MRIDIQDSAIRDFSKDAKNKLVATVKDYITAIINESRSIEKADSLGGRDSQVIAIHVDKAKKNYKMSLCGRKVFWNVLLDFLIFALGFISDVDWILKDSIHLIIYIVFLAVVLTLTVMKHMKGR